MAINPNTDFTTGAVYTADQANRFPRGVMAYNEVTADDLTITTEEVQITGSSFTAVANRYYRVTYYEPNVASSTATGFAIARLRLTNISGAIKQVCVVQLPTSNVSNAFFNLQFVGTLSAGTTNFVATAQSGTGTAINDRAATSPAFLLVEDIGPA
jgi:hypothetical protein